MSPRRQMKIAAPVPVVDTTGCTFDRELHRYEIDGLEVPSVTQVLEAEQFIDFSMVPDATLDAAKARGSYVHTVLHYWLEGDFDLPDVDPRFRGYVDSALGFLDAAKLRGLRHPVTDAPIAVEYRFWDRVRMFAGTMDYVAWDPDDVLGIFDWKTGEPTDVAAALQTAAYEYGLRLTLFPDHKFPIRRRAVKLFKDGRPARPEPYDDPRDLGMFLNALTCVHFRRNRMRHSA